MDASLQVYIYRMSVNDWYTFADKIWGNYKSTPKYNQYQLKFQKWWYNSILPILIARHRNFWKWCLPERRAFVWLNTEKQVNAPVFSGSSEKDFVRNHFLEHQHRCSLSTPKTRDEFVRRKAVIVLMWEKSKEICMEGKPWVTDAENDCVASSTQMGSNETLQI
jgi:hypothetical protein